MITKIKNWRNNNSEEGFTLVELMIVVVIIGILAAIAIPVFANQQKATLDASVESDLNSAKTAIATWMAKNPTASSFAAATTDVNNNYSVSDSATTIRVYGSPLDWCLTGFNPNADQHAGGPSNIYLVFRSTTGQTASSAVIGGVSSRSCYTQTGGTTWILN